MEKLINKIHDLILQNWNTSQSVLSSQVPDNEDVDLSKLIINYSPPWYVAILSPSDGKLILTYSRVDEAADLPHLLLNYDHTSTEEYFKRYASKFLMVEDSSLPGFYSTEIYDSNGNFLELKTCTVEEFIDQIELEVAPN